MTEAKSPSKTWLLRAWLYGVPLAFVALSDFFFWLGIPTFRERIIVCSVLGVSVLVNIHVGRKLEAEFGLDALPRRSEFLYFALGIGLWLTVMSIIHPDIHRWHGSGPFLMLMSMTPVAFTRVFRKRESDYD